MREPEIHQMWLALEIRRAKWLSVQGLNRKWRRHLPFPAGNSSFNHFVETWVGFHLCNVDLCDFSSLCITSQEPRNTPVIVDDFQNDVCFAFDWKIELMRKFREGRRFVR